MPGRALAQAPAAAPAASPAPRSADAPLDAPDAPGPPRTRGRRGPHRGQPPRRGRGHPPRAAHQARASVFDPRAPPRTPGRLGARLLHRRAAARAAPAQGRHRLRGARAGAARHPRGEARRQRRAEQGRPQGVHRRQARHHPRPRRGAPQRQKKIQEKYVEKGYFLAEVTYRLDPVRSGQVDVVFVIDEHAKVMVKEISFLGAEKVSAGRAQGRDADQGGRLLSFLTGEGTYREEVFQRDLAVIQAAYYDRGFINVRVDKPTVSLSADKRYIYITLQIDRGRAATTSARSTSPATCCVAQGGAGAADDVRHGRALQPLQARRRTSWPSPTSTTTRATPTPTSTPSPQSTPTTKTVDLTFDMQKGPQVNIERIDIVGNTKTRDKVIRREMRVYEGELFSGTGMRRSKERVTALGFFETVDVTQQAGHRDDTSRRQVEVKEKATGTFQVGLGFSNVENFIFTAQVSQNNFLGWGQSVSASAQISGAALARAAVLLRPVLPRHQVHLLRRLLPRARPTTTASSATPPAATCRLGYQIIEDVLGQRRLHARVRERVRPAAALGARAAGQPASVNGVTSSVRLSAHLRQARQPPLPLQGLHPLRLGGVRAQLPGRHFLFTRYTAYSRLYFPLPLGARLQDERHRRLHPAAGRQPPAAHLRALLPGRHQHAARLLPAQHQPHAARRPARARPTPPSASSTWAATSSSSSTWSWSSPSSRRSASAACSSTTRATPSRPTSASSRTSRTTLPLGLFHSVGFGFRWFSPIGPLRFEWGIPLTKRPDDEPILFEFTIGNFF